MRVLIIGSGAREHALAWKFSKSKRISGLFITPGNAGTQSVGTNFPDVDPLNFAEVARLCSQTKVDLVFVGPEQPLAEGIVDDLGKRGIQVIGPSREASLLESSKVFSKRFMLKHGIPTGEANEYDSFESFELAIGTIRGPVVIKKSGLAAGKGVLESSDPTEILSFGKQILKDDSLLVEEYLEGFELSVFALLDGESYLLLPACADFKKAGEGDTGPNTGGMGAICPVPSVDHEVMSRIEEDIVKPSVEALKLEGLLYCGILYFGLMMTEQGPKVLEFNVRFGDPESQTLLPIIDTDFCDLTEAMLNRGLSNFPIRHGEKSAVGVVVASPGYPKSYKKGISVAPLPDFNDEEVIIFHAATRRDNTDQLLTGGGRCFTVVGIGGDLLSANREAYSAVKKVRFTGAWYRNDIGKKFFED